MFARAARETCKGAQAQQTQHAQQAQPLQLKGVKEGWLLIIV